MASFFRSLVWLVLIVAVGLAATLLVANAIIRSQFKPIIPILARDNVGVGSHTLSGNVPVQSTCDEVIVDTEKTSDTSYTILFSTWREPYIPTCASQEVLREFHAIIFAPSLGVSFAATLNGHPVPIAVIPEIPLRTPMPGHPSTKSEAATSTH